MSSFKSVAAKERYLAHLAARAREWPVPSKERVLETRFGQTFVRESGPAGGVPLLLLPGIGSNGLSLAPTVRGLSGPLRTFAIDNIHDVGRSIETRAVTSGDDFAVWLDEVRAGLGLDVVDVLGLSYGGWVASQFALAKPDVVRKLVLLAPAGVLSPLPWSFIWRAILCALPSRATIRNFMNWLAPALRGTERLEHLVEDGVLAGRSFKSRKMVPPMPLSDAQWRQLAPKTLLAAGDLELIFDAPTHLARVAALGVKTASVPGAGHDFFDARADEVNALVLSFLR